MSHINEAARPKGESSLLRTAEAAKYIDRSESWVVKERLAGRGPRFIRIGGSVRYRHADLDAYLEGNVVETTDTRKKVARSGKAAA